MRRYSPLLLILVLLGSLAVSQAAAATLPQAPAATLPSPQGVAAEAEEEEPEAEEEFKIEGEFEIEECEATAQEVEFGEMEEAEEEEEFEEGVEECEAEAEKSKGKKGEGFVTAPAECLVQRAESTITTLPGTDSVRLTVHYKNYSSAPVSIGLKLKDHKGSIELGHTMKHFGKGGVLHLTTKLGEAEMERATKAMEFDVALRAADTPGYCGNMLEQHLRSRGAPATAHGSRLYGEAAD